MKKIVKLILAALLAFSFAACSSSGSDNGTKTTVVKVGVVGEYNAQWDTVNEILAKDNIKVELVRFNDYSIPNDALNSGEIDLNAFQHHAFLENDIAANGYDIVAIADTLIAPLAVFNNKDKISSVEEFKDGDIIAIPADRTNGGRALKILEAIGLIVCDPAMGYLPTVADITKYNVKIEIKELESGMLASILPDVTAALINGGNAFTAGLNPVKDSIYVEELGEDVARLHNLIAARTADKDNEVYKKVVEAYQTAEVANKILEAYEGAFLPAFDY